MKLHTNHNVIERGGIASETSFTIKTNALSFNILSSGLYTDPIMAIVRELSCNAYDAHVAAKRADKPFEVHLPNELEPFLSIKDYGTGLSDEDIQGRMEPVMVTGPNGELIQEVDANGEPVFVRTGGLYTTYFDSSKTDSNDYIGALGLGSKSPFSYSDAFEVISRFEGKRRTYAIFLNESGIPTVALMGENETDEESGLEVIITIQQEDFNKFSSRTATALKYFPVKPKVTGALHFDFDALPSQRIETKDWMIAPSNWSGSEYIAVQGNVAYRVDVNQLRSSLDKDLLEFLNDSKVVTFFNIGELEVSANREEIRYDKRSLAAMVIKLKKVHKEFSKVLEKKLGKINKKYWQACIELNKLSSDIFGSTSSIYNFLDEKEIKNKRLKRYIKNAGSVKFTSPQGYDLMRYKLKHTRSNIIIKRFNLYTAFEPKADTLIVINDVRTGGLKRIKEYLENNSYSEAIVLTKRSEPTTKIIDGKEVKFIGYEKEMKRLLQELGSPDIHKISEITEKPERARRGTSTVIKFYQYDGEGYVRRHSGGKIRWDIVQRSINDGGLYFPLQRAVIPCFVDEAGNWQDIGLTYRRNFVAAMEFITKKYNEVYGTNYSMNDIVGVTASTYKKVTKTDNWVNVFDFLKEILIGYEDDIVYRRRMESTNNTFGIQRAIDDDSFINQVNDLDDDSVFKQNVLILVEAKQNHDIDTLKNIDNIKSLYSKFYNLHDLSNKPYFEENAFDKYPVLQLTSNFNYIDDRSILFDYIKLIDRSE